MGCSSSKDETIKGLNYDAQAAPISCGADKYVFEGTFQKKKVAVIVARSGGERRIMHEIGLFQKIGKHKHIIEMYVTGKDAFGMPLAAVEAVEPIGYDMSRMVNQYSWTGQGVPGALMCKLVRQLISALQHMHKLELIHQDLKVQNVLVTIQHDVKLIDMGIVVKIGERGKLKAAYLAPEVCSFQILTEKVDCWGVGLILHQVYQKRATLLRIGSKVDMKRGMPSKEHPMADDVREAMCGLLTFDREERWSLQQTLDSVWFKNSQTCDRGLSFANDGKAEAKRRFLQKYAGPAGSMGTQVAYAAFIESSMSHINGKCLGELNFGRKHGITVLLIAKSDGTFVRVPGMNTKLTAGTWIYFGIKTDAFQEDDESDEITPALTNICQTLYGKNYDPQNKAHDISDVGRFTTFILEFDCFAFPDRKCGKYVLGADAREGAVPLDLRRTLNLNIAGLVTKQGIEWYPQADSIVEPGDLGLVVRAPQMNGMSVPTVVDKDLEPFMNVDCPLPTAAAQVK